MKTVSVRFFILAVFAVLCSSSTFAFSQQQVKWYTDFAKATEQAKAENKTILIDFTGSDWCPWCIKMKKETLDQAVFKDYAAKNLVLMEADFPNSKPQTESVKKQNAELQSKYKAKGFPSFVMVDKDGKELGIQVGYLEGGPDKFIALLNKWHKPDPTASSSTPAAGSGSGGSDFDNFFKK